MDSHVSSSDDDGKIPAEVLMLPSNPTKESSPDNWPAAAGPLDEYPADVVTEYLPSTVSDGGSSECSGNGPLDHAMDESELGEFLMDTFEGVDVMAVLDYMPELDP